MTSSTKLPTKIRVAAKRLFAGATGLSKREIADFMCRYSDEVPEYPWAGCPELRSECLEQLLGHMSPHDQLQALLGLCDYPEEMAYGQPPAKAVEELRGWLRELDGPTAMADPGVPIDWPFVDQSWKKALEEISADPEGAVSSARSLLETVCKHILDEREVEYSEDGDVGRLLKAAMSALRFSENAKADACMRQMAGGMGSVVNGLAGLRNEQGDSHGKGKGYIGPAPLHARFAVNAAGAVSGFLIELHQAEA